MRITNRFWLPRTKLKGFKTRNVGPVDNNDYVGGNFVSSINSASIIEESGANSEGFKTIVPVSYTHLTLPTKA